VVTTYADLHELVDRLTPEQADAVRGVVRQLVAAPAGHADAPAAKVDPEGRVRRLSFAGTLRTGRGVFRAQGDRPDEPQLAAVAFDLDATTGSDESHGSEPATGRYARERR
jgi:hypothetical protein